MKQDRIKWNEKYRKESFPTEVASVVKKFYHLAPGKKALDIAASIFSDADHLLPRSWRSGDETFG